MAVKRERFVRATRAQDRCSNWETERKGTQKYTKKKPRSECQFV